MSDRKNIWNSALASDSEKVLSARGRNIIPEPEGKSLLSAYLEKLKDPLIVILLVILVLSCFVSGYEFSLSHDYKLFFEPAGILMAILLSTGIGFWFEVKADGEFKILSKVKDDRMVKVIRRRTEGSKPQMVSVRKCDIAEGDIVKLDSGDEAPADGFVLEGTSSLKIDESAFTGEPYAEKGADISGRKEECAYPYNFILRGTIVIEGSCYYRVSATGSDTEEGKGAVLLQQDEQVKTPLNAQLNSLGIFLTKASYIIAALIVLGRIAYWFILGEGSAADTVHFLEYLLGSVMIAVTLIVVAVPEGLPMSVNISLALSMKKMLSQKNLVRRMHACETMGATTVICTDKTGTLTQNRMSVMEADFVSTRDLTLAGICVNSTAELSQAEDGSPIGIGNPTEVALLRYIESHGASYSEIRDSFTIKGQEPFSTELKYMSTTAEGPDGRTYKFLKGAPEIILSGCDAFPEAETLESINAKLSSYQGKAMRTLAFAVQDVTDGEDSPTVYMGIIGIADPVRDGVRDAIRSCTEDAGVRVIIVTGDIAPTAREIGRQIGLGGLDDTDAVLTGTEFAQMDDEKVLEILPKLRILSRARPEDKARLVGLLQRSGEVVAVTGDGTNDALALKKAQVGLSMGDGTARAKEVSDITIIDNSFSSICSAIMWGRSLYLNIRRFIIFQMTINVCACLTVLAGALTGVESPLTVTQMLWVNLIMDTFAAMALSSLPPDPKVMFSRPRDPKSHIVDGAMAKAIIFSGELFFAVLAGFWLVFGRIDLTAVKDLFSMATYSAASVSPAGHSTYELGVFFCTFVIIQFWNLFNTRYFRTGRSLLLDGYDIIMGRRKAKDCFSAGFVLIACVILIGQIVIVNFAGQFFDVEPLKVSDWFWILVLTSPVLIIPEIVRTLKGER